MSKNNVAAPLPMGIFYFDKAFEFLYPLSYPKYRFFFNLSFDVQVYLLKLSQNLKEYSEDAVFSLSQTLSLDTQPIRVWLKSRCKQVNIMRYVTEPHMTDKQIDVILEEFQRVDGMNDDEATLWSYLLTVSQRHIIGWFKKIRQRYNDKRNTILMEHQERLNLYEKMVLSSQDKAEKSKREDDEDAELSESDKIEEKMANDLTIVFNEYKRNSVIDADRLNELSAHVTMPTPLIKTWFDGVDSELKNVKLDELEEFLQQNLNPIQVVGLELKYSKRQFITKREAAALAKKLELLDGAAQALNWFIKRRLKELYTGNEEVVVPTEYIDNDVLRPPPHLDESLIRIDFNDSLKRDVFGVESESQVPAYQFEESELLKQQRSALISERRKAGAALLRKTIQSQKPVAESKAPKYDVLSATIAENAEKSAVKLPGGVIVERVPSLPPWAKKSDESASVDTDADDFSLANLPATATRPLQKSSAPVRPLSVPNARYGEKERFTIPFTSSQPVNTTAPVTAPSNARLPPSIAQPPPRDFSSNLLSSYFNKTGKETDSATTSTLKKSFKKPSSSATSTTQSVNTKVLPSKSDKNKPSSRPLGDKHESKKKKSRESRERDLSGGSKKDKESFRKSKSPASFKSSSSSSKKSTSSSSSHSHDTKDKEMATAPRFKSPTPPAPKKSASSLHEEKKSHSGAEISNSAMAPPMQPPPVKKNKISKTIKQYNTLFEEFKKSRHLNESRVEKLVRRTDMDEKTVRKWFVDVNKAISERTQQNVRDTLMQGLLPRQIKKLTKLYDDCRYHAPDFMADVAADMNVSKALIKNWFADARYYELITGTNFKLESLEDTSHKARKRKMQFDSDSSSDEETTSSVRAESKSYSQSASSSTLTLSGPVDVMLKKTRKFQIRLTRIDNLVPAATRVEPATPAVTSAVEPATLATTPTMEPPATPVTTSTIEPPATLATTSTMEPPAAPATTSTIEPLATPATSTMEPQATLASTSTMEPTTLAATSIIEPATLAATSAMDESTTTESKFTEEEDVSMRSEKDKKSTTSEITTNTESECAEKDASAEIDKNSKLPTQQDTLFRAFIKCNGDYSNSSFLDEVAKKLPELSARKIEKWLSKQRTKMEDVDNKISLEKYNRKNKLDEEQTKVLEHEYARCTHIHDAILKRLTSQLNKDEKIITRWFEVRRYHDMKLLRASSLKLSIKSIVGHSSSKTVPAEEKISPPERSNTVVEDVDVDDLSDETLLDYPFRRAGIVNVKELPDDVVPIVFQKGELPELEEQMNAGAFTDCRSTYREELSDTGDLADVNKIFWYMRPDVKNYELQNSTYLSDSDLEKLETIFESCRSPSLEELGQYAKKLRVSEQAVYFWFMLQRFKTKSNSDSNDRSEDTTAGKSTAVEELKTSANKEEEALEKSIPQSNIPVRKESNESNVSYLSDNDSSMWSGDENDSNEIKKVIDIL